MPNLTPGPDPRIQATSYTTGQAVTFTPPADSTLVAHEAAHVVQQNEGTTASPTPSSNDVNPVSFADFDPVSSPFQAEAAAPARAAASQDPPPAVRAPYNELAVYAKSNQNINYLEIERGNVNRNLARFLQQYQEQLNQNPELRDKLAQSEVGQKLLAALDRMSQTGTIGTQDILDLQQFIVASGINIGTDASPHGIDGLYGPQTHAGLQQAFDALLADPDTAIAGLEAGLERATTGMDYLRQAQDGEIDLYDPTRSEGLPDSDPVNPTGPPPDTTDLGRRIWESAQQTARERSPRGLCMQGVRQTLDRIGIHLRDENGNNLRSAYMAADALATRYQDQFTEMRPVSRSQLRSLPPGAIVVWDRNPDPSRRADNPSNGYSHGHIEIIGPNGQAVSDGAQSWGITMNNNGRYGGFRVFLPNG